MNFTKSQKIFIVFIIISILAIGLIYFVLIPKQKTKSIQPSTTDEKIKETYENSNQQEYLTQQEIYDDLQSDVKQKDAIGHQNQETQPSEEKETDLEENETVLKEKKINRLRCERAKILVELDEISRNRRKASEKLNDFHDGQNHRPLYVDECINPKCLKNLEIRDELVSKFNKLCKKRQSIDQQITQLQGQDQQ